MDVERVGGHLEALTLQVCVWVCVCICVLARGRGAHLGDVAVAPQALEPKLPP